MPNLLLMSLNVTGGPLEFDAVVNIDQGLKQINNLGNAWNSIGDKTKKNAFIDSFVTSLKENIKGLGTQVNDIKAKIKELESQPIGNQDFEGIKKLNDELSQTETAIQFLTQLTDNLSGLPSEFTGSANAAGKLSTQLRALRDDLAKMKAAGQDSTPEFGDKIEQAAHLEEALKNVNRELTLQSSNVAGVEALREGFKGLIGGAEAFAGVMGLLTDDQEQAEVIIKNLIALQSVLNGVEEVGAILEKNSALNVYLLALQRKLAGKAAVEQAVSTEVLTGAQAEGVVATEAATIAQTGLNAALLANPVGAILVSVVALYGAYELLSNTLFKASDAEKEREASLKALSEAEAKAADSTAEEEGKLNILISTAKNKVLSDEERIAAISNLRAQYPEYLSNLSLENIQTKEISEAIRKQTELIKARSLERAAEEVYVESIKEQIKKQNELNDTLRNGSGFWKSLWATIKSGNSVPPQVTIINEKLHELDDATLKVDGTFRTFIDAQDATAKQMAGTTGAVKDQRTAFSDWANEISSASKLITGFSTATNLFAKSQQKVFSKEEFDAEKKRITELNQYEIDKTQEGTVANLKARKKMQQELAALEKTNPVLFQNGQPVSELIDPRANAEAKKIIGDIQKEIDSVNEQLTEKALQNATAGANALVLALQAAGDIGSKKYFDAQETALKKAAVEQIVQAKDNAGKVREIQAKLALDLVNLDKDRLRQQLENEKSINNTRLTLIEQGSKEELDLRLKNIDIDTKEELLAVGKNQDKINEINAVAAKKKSDLQKQYAIEAAETETNIRIAQIETQLAAVRNGSDEELNLKKQLVDQKAALDIEEKQKQIKNEKLLAATIAQINAQVLRDKRKLEDEFVNDLLSRQFKLFDQQESSNNLKNDFVINDPRSTNTQKATAELDKLEEAGLKIKKEINAITNQIASNRGDITVLSAQLNELENKKDQNANDLALQKLKLSLAKLEDIKDSASQVESAFKNLSTAAGAFNDELGKSFAQLSGIAGSVTGIADGLKAFKTAKSKDDLLGQVTSVTSIISAVTTAISIVVNKIKEAVAAAKEARDTVRAYNDQLITGESEYQAMLRERERQVVALNKLTIDGLKAQQALLEKQQQTNKSSFDDLLKQIQKETFVVSETQGKKSLFSSKSLKDLLGGEIKTVTESLAGKTFDQLEELFTKGQLTGKAKDLFQQLKQLHDEGVDIDQQLSDLKEKAAETFTGTTAQSIADTIAQGFADGKRTVADFASDFEDLMRQAIINSLKLRFLEGPVKDLFDQFATDTQSGDKLTKSEIDDLKNKYNAIIKNAASQFDQLQQIAGVNFSSTTSSQQNVLSGAFRTMTEDTGNLLAGQFGAVRIAQLQLVDLAKISNNHLYAIETNTFNTVVELRTVVQKMDFYYGTQGVKLK